jgi:hypothetical protein
MNQISRKYRALSRTFVLCAIIASVACSAARDETTQSILSVERSQAGDTVIVHNTGADSPDAVLNLVKELVIGKVVGSDQEMFGQIRTVHAADDGGIVASEFIPYRIQRFDSAGTLTRSYGARGEGPG